MDPWTRCTQARRGVSDAGALSGRRRAGRRVLALTALLASVAMACEVPDTGEDVQQEGTPEPPADLTDPMEAGQRQRALEYARELRFAEGDEYHWAWDKQHLHMVTTEAEEDPQAVRGPLGTIWPQFDSHANSRDDLRRGRILAKIELDGPYPRLGLPAGVSYVWVDGTSSATRQAQPTRTIRQSGAQERPSYRAVIVPEDPDVEPVERDVYEWVHPEGGPRVQLPLARWLWSADGVIAWFTCGGYCCEPR